MDYIKNFTDSFKLWWNHKYLWILGIIGVVLSGTGGVSQIQNSFKSDNPLFKNSQFDSSLVIFLLIIIALISVAIAIVSVYLTLRVESSLIQSAKLLRDKKSLDFKKAWALGNKYLLKLFVNSLLISLPIFLILFILVILIIVGALSLATPLLAIPLFLIAFLIFLIMMAYILFAALIRPISERFIVLEGKENVEALKLSLSFIKSNLGSLVMVWLVLIGVNIIISVVSLPLSLMFAAITLPAIALLALNPIIGIIGFIVAQLIVSLLSSLIGGPQLALTSIYWTNSFLEIKQEKK